ncbi:phosphodiesterase [Halomonas sp. Bachu 37]|uniref:phosphodiesterase n=1 Tax=Halomonas kashgarensis TaxID=3084920 RepID=UPI003216FCAF
MRLVQITDCHLHADPEAPSRAGFPLRQFQIVVQQVIEKRPDIVVVSGDISQDETSASYVLAKEILASLPCPWFWLPGNHDQPELMEAVHPLHREVDMQGWRLLLLHTQVSGQPHGELGAEQLAELVERLENDVRPTVIAMHHPPLDVGTAWMDRIGLQDREAFWQSLAAYPQVKVILFGHAHQAFARLQGFGDHVIGVYGCPSTTDQFLAGAEHFTIDEASRPGYRVIDLHSGRAGNAGWTTWIERVDL